MTKWAMYASHLGAYMKRWILRTPWGTLRLHRILQSDAGRDFHDHPFSFVSVILTGGYIEHRPGCECWQSRGRTFVLNYKTCLLFRAPAIVRRRATEFHRLELIDGPTTTFVISSRYFRPWGFLLDDRRWVPYQEYHRSLYREDAETVGGRS
jgi:hypothetical protein